MRTVRPPAPVRVLALALLAGGVAGGFAAGAQQSLDPSSFVVAEPGAPGTNAELRAWSFVRQEKLVKAREAAEEVVREDPRSYVGHFVLAYAHHYGEANFPKALYHANRAEALFTERHGREPPPGGPWRWHARLLLELAAIHGDLEHYEERLRYLGRYNEIYDPDVVAEQAWALMKQGRFDEARRVARAGLATNDPRQVEIALNALCAVEFEAGNDGESYVACRRALEHARSTPGDPNAVDLTNFAEAARSMFRLAEAERVLLEATEAPAAWYGNPWLELAELYTRGARFPEALDALERVPGYRAQRPPHVRESDRNEHRRALAAFFLTVGRSEEALEITRTALVAPDRRAHNSRDPAQDRAVVALLDRSARLAVASRRREAAAGAPVWERALAWAAAGRLRFEAWMSGRQAVRLLSDDDRFVGLFRIGTARSAIVPPWLVGELVDVAGAGVVSEAVRRARAEDARAGADAYYDAFAAEAALEAGDEARAIELAERARDGLGDGEALLRARANALRAEAIRRERGVEAALPAYALAMQKDPGVFRRLGLTLPIRVTPSGDAMGEAAASALGRSPRFEVGEVGMEATIQPLDAGLRICLRGPGGVLFDCADAAPESGDTPEETAAAAVDAFQRAVFAPRIDLSQADIHSLDGSNRVTRDPLDGLTPPGP